MNVGMPTTTHNDPKIAQAVRESSDKAVQEILERANAETGEAPVH